VKHFKHYLYGKQFIVRTDHGSLRWLLNFKNPEGQMATFLGTGHDSTIFVFSGSVAIPASDITCPK
jgi:hypothetical protein